ncbi:MAG: metallophosphatase domain-containing protein [Kofleriaceae bacterium]|nr:metallophosphatase domain-containing protein [Kofleriaceae bacterium]
MRIVAVADTHMRTAGLVIPDGDVFIHAGDICGFGELAELRAAAAWLRALPHRHKIVIAGNHDWCFVRHPAEARALVRDLHYLEDAELVLDGVRFYGSPWQPEFNNWAFNLPRGEALAAVWRKIPRGVDILITHGPPEGMGDQLWDGARVGCADLRQRVAELLPQVHMFGHIHEDGGVWNDGTTVFANVTTNAGARGATVFDLDDARLTRVIAPPRDRYDDGDR